MKVGFLGFGNIAKAAVEGLNHKKLKNISEIYVSSANLNTLKNDAKELVRKIVEGDKNVFISRSSKAS